MTNLQEHYISDDLFTSSMSPKNAVKFIRRMQGSSQAVLVECDDGNHYVVKMVGCPDGPNVLANEWLGTVLATAVGLPVSTSKFVYFGPSFLAPNPSLRFELLRGKTQTPPGLHIGSPFAGEPTGPHRLIQYLPRSEMGNVTNRACFLGMYLFDVWAAQRGPRKVLFRRTGLASALEAVFIGHSNLFGGSNWNFSEPKPVRRYQEPSLYSGPWSNRAIDSWIETLRSEVPRVLSSVLASVPTHWYVGDLSVLRAFLLARLNDLPDLFERCSILDGLQSTELRTHPALQRRGDLLC